MLEIHFYKKEKKEKINSSSQQFTLIYIHRYFVSSGVTSAWMILFSRSFISIRKVAFL